MIGHIFTHHRVTQNYKLFLNCQGESEKSFKMVEFYHVRKAKAPNEQGFQSPLS